MAMRWLALVVAVLAGCAELSLSDGTSISVGKPSGGYLVAGVRLPDRGDGWVTREVWRARNNRFGTEELVDLLTAVARRMRAQIRDVKLVVADLSGKDGGERVAFHRSHQTGRDVDLLYYMRDAAGAPLEPDAMRVFDATGRAVDGSGIAIDIARTWTLVKELVTAPEAPVQWVFMYEPIAQRLIEHAQRTGEPEAVIARARKTLKQPGDSARHDDHLHVRVYCSTADKAYGCVDLGPMELLVEREAEPSAVATLVAALTSAPPAAPGSPATGAAPPASVVGLTSAVPAPALAAQLPRPASLAGGDPAAALGPQTARPASLAAALTVQQLGRLLRVRPSWMTLRRLR